MIIFLSGYMTGYAMCKMERSEKKRSFVYVTSFLVGLSALLALLRFFRSVS